MGDRTRIEWTNATWNPVTGCTRISAGCDNCYAATLAHKRLKAVYLRRRPSVDTQEHRTDPFAVRLWPERLAQLKRWREPRRVFVNSMSDLFHTHIPEEYVRRVFRVMLEADHHLYQILTKRPGRALRFWQRNADLFDGAALPEHIWLGTSVELQEVAYRVEQLRQVPAALRFLSCEPLLGPLEVNLDEVHWVIVGGESGVGHRPMDPAWARSVRDQCVEQGVPFFFKQWGGRTPKAGGRLLDGRTWEEYPAAAVAAV